MTYEEAFKLISVEYLYYGVSIEDITNCPVDHYTAEIDGVKLLGTSTPITGLEPLQLIPIVEELV
jgi:hypothetical protein